MEKKFKLSTTNENKLNWSKIGHTKLTHGYLMAKNDSAKC